MIGPPARRGWSAWRPPGFPPRPASHRSPCGRQATGGGGGDAVRDAKLARLEAALFVADGPVSVRELVRAAALVDGKEARALLETLNERLDADGTAFRVEPVARGYRLLTRRHLAPWLDRLHKRPPRHALTAPLLETLTIVAYRQPCTRAAVDAVRGVASADLLKQLLDRKLIHIAGEEQTLGRPFLYGTRGEFLEAFGLRSLAELPEIEGLPRPAVNGRGTRLRRVGPARRRRAATGHTPTARRTSAAISSIPRTASPSSHGTRTQPSPVASSPYTAATRAR